MFNMLTEIKTRDELMLFCALSVNARLTSINHIYINAIFFCSVYTVYITPFDVM